MNNATDPYDVAAQATLLLRALERSSATASKLEIAMLFLGIAHAAGVLDQIDRTIARMQNEEGFLPAYPS